MACHLHQIRALAQLQVQADKVEPLVEADTEPDLAVVARVEIARHQWVRACLIGHLLPAEAGMVGPETTVAHPPVVAAVVAAIVAGAAPGVAVLDKQVELAGVLKGQHYQGSTFPTPEGQGPDHLAVSDPWRSQVGLRFQRIVAMYQIVRR